MGKQSVSGPVQGSGGYLGDGYLHLGPCKALRAAEKRMSHMLRRRDTIWIYTEKGRLGLDPDSINAWHANYAG